MKIKKIIYDIILSSYPIPPPENGGILGMKNGVVCEYYHDDFCMNTDRAVYEPDVDILNQKISEWDKQNVQFGGIIHSHMSSQESLSNADVDYIRTIFNVLPEWVQELYFPIVIPQEKQMISYLAKRSKDNIIIRQDEIHII